MPRSRLDAFLAVTLDSFRHDSRSDGELLLLFLERKEEAAFETLMRRHTLAVRAVCRSWLRAEADIEDAVQATFLVLIQRARSIRDPSVLGPWLYTVARRVARRLRQQRRPSCPLPDNLPERQPTGDEGLRDLLQEEIARLPEKYRLAVQLCYVAGLTTAEAARRLGWPKGTVLTRLAWARERLQKRLTQQGVVPAVVASLFLGAVAAPVVSGAWVQATTKAAKAILTGDAPILRGVSEATFTLSEGVVRAMFYDRVKYIALGVLLTVGVAGFGIGHWAAASNGTNEASKPAAKEADSPTAHRLPRFAVKEKEEDEPLAKPKGKAEEARPGAAGRRREAVIHLPSGTFSKEVEVATYGSGRLTWNYEDERVLGLIEGSVMGFEFELSTEAEYALSSNGTIYGLLTSVRLNHLRVPESEEFAALKPFIGLWPVAEPLLNETLMDLPFSYQFRVQGDRLIISNFRILLSGPNPLGKLGGLAVGQDGSKLAILSYFQALGTAFEGSYTAGDVKEKVSPKKRPLFPKSGNRDAVKTIK